MAKRKSTGSRSVTVKTAPRKRLLKAPRSPAKPIGGLVYSVHPGVAMVQRWIDELIKIAQQLGDDVRICPCKTIVPLYRRHVFAQIKPAAQKRINLGLALGE